MVRLKTQIMTALHRHTRYLSNRAISCALFRNNIVGGAVRVQIHELPPPGISLADSEAACRVLMILSKKVGNAVPCSP